MEQVVEFIMGILDPIGVVLGLLIAVASIGVFLYQGYQHFIGKHRRIRRRFAEARQYQGECIGILTVDLLPGKNIQTKVSRYCDQQATLSEVPEARRIVIERIEPTQVNDMPRLSQDIRQAAAEFSQLGVDTVHCFYAGPSVVAALIGAEFANSGHFLLYQHGHEGYVNFGPLRPL